jgi:glycosyltransferase involved in cell wall biosynthesis
MKIFYDYQIFSYKYGGILRYFCEIIPRLAEKENCTIECMAGFNRHRYGLAQRLRQFKNTRYVGWHIPDIPKTGKLFNFLNKALFIAISKKIKKTDVYHPTYYWPGVFQKIKAKRILTVVDMIHERFPEYFSKDNKTIEQKRKCIQSADSIIAISENTKKDIIDIYNIPEDKVFVTYLANSLKEIAEDYNPKVKFSDYILYVGYRGRYKNFERALTAYANSKSIMNNFNLVCFGGGEFSDKEKEILKKKRIESKVFQISGDDKVLAAFYKNASLLICPSLYEGFGLPLLEAMHFGCPVAASNTSSIPEVVGGAGEYFDPYSEESISFAIEKILFNEAYRKVLIEKGYKQEKQFSWDKCAQETYKIYEQL